jgi:L-lactate dehydrogenase complex protein LldG
MTARDEVLARIRTANRSGAPGQAGPPADDPDARYRTRGELSGQALLDLLAARLTDYRAIVHVVTPAALPAEIDAALRRRGARTVVVPPALGLPLPDFAAVIIDSGDSGDSGELTARDLDGMDAVVTRAAVAIAETGTIVLDGAPDQGRRAISLVPDYHLCVVAAEQVVHLVPEGVTRLANVAGRPLTWISGPSATSDIELERVEGVHGPRTLEVLLVAG